MQEGILTPFPDNTLRPSAPITRAQAIEILGAHRAWPPARPGLVSAEFRGMSGGGLTVRSATRARPRCPSTSRPRLFRALDGARLGSVRAGPGRRATRSRFVAQGGRVTFLEAEQSLLGASADRRRSYYRWEVRMTPDEVAKAIARYGTVGHGARRRPQALRRLRARDRAGGRRQRRRAGAATACASAGGSACARTCS